jgi:hypothetical protein
MFGELLSDIIRVATIPLDVAESAIDVMFDGDGSRESKRDTILVGGELRDKVCEVVESIDK